MSAEKTLQIVWSFPRNALHLRCRTSERTPADILQDEQDELLGLDKIWKILTTRLHSLVKQILFPSPKDTDCFSIFGRTGVFQNLIKQI